MAPRSPDAYKVAGVTRRTSAKFTREALLRTIRELEEPAAFRRLFLFYTKDSNDAVLPAIAAEWDPAAREVSGIVL